MTKGQRTVYDGYWSQVSLTDTDGTTSTFPVTSIDISEYRNKGSDRGQDAPRSRITPLELLFLPGMCVLEVRTADGQWHDVKCSRDMHELKTLQAGLRYHGHNGFHIIQAASWP